MSKTTWPSIPDPTSDPKSLVACIKALTDTVNMLTGSAPQSGLGTGRVPVLYMDDAKPDPDSVEEGDLWLGPGFQLFVCSTKSPLQMWGTVGGRLTVNSQSSTGKQNWVPITAVIPENRSPYNDTLNISRTQGGMNR